MTTAQEHPTMWPDLRRVLESGNGVYETSMTTLGNLEGYKRIDSGAVRKIDARLAELGIGHIPQTLPKRGPQTVTLYDKRSEAAEIVDAIQSDKSTQALAVILRRLNAASAPQEDVVPASAARDALNDALEAISHLRETIAP